MERNSDLKRQLIHDLLIEHPGIPCRRAGSILAEKHPEWFSTPEAARSAVRYVTGQNGAINRPGATMPRPAGDREARMRQMMPPSRAGIREPYTLPLVDTLVLSDLHVPYHDVDAIEAALEWADGRYGQILINGDLLDCHPISRFVPKLGAVSMAEEVALGRQMVAFLAGIGKPVYYKLGNHDERLEDYMSRKAPEIADVVSWQMEHVLGCAEHGVTVIGDKRRVLLSGLNILHGHELMRGLTAPVNPARGAYLKASANTLIGHHHKTSEHVETDLEGSITGCWSAGCLCDLSPDYMPYGKCNHGFALVTVRGDGFTVTNKMIYRGRVL